MTLSTAEYLLHRVANGSIATPQQIASAKAVVRRWQAIRARKQVKR